MLTVGKKDAVTKEYMRNPVAFADVFNVFLYGGEQVIKPDALSKMDTTEIALPHARNGKSVYIQRTRDVMKEWISMTDGRAAYCLFAVENQDKVHYAMPIRTLLSDAMSLARQVQDIANRHRAEHAKATSAEYLSGMHKDDTVLPVITLVIYWGHDDWDGALSLRELYGDVDASLLRYAADYRVNLISPKTLTPEKLQEFHSGLGQVFTFVKYSQDKEKLLTAMQMDAGFADMSRQDIELINAVTGNNIELPSGKERINVCKAIEDMLDEARSQGTSQGRSQEKERFASKLLKRYVKKNVAITEDVLADIAEDGEISIDKLRRLAAENGISLA